MSYDDEMEVDCESRGELGGSNLIDFDCLSVSYIDYATIKSELKL